MSNSVAPVHTSAPAKFKPKARHGAVGVNFAAQVADLKRGGAFGDFFG
ncbi:hypothetical protein JQV71_04935 [Sulfitobacter geojensis]|nr:hypothetical protein [Sulfitobacter geojensis]MBM1798278.1 hypothetical protein [Sulfitobacter geojensis]